MNGIGSEERTRLSVRQTAKGDVQLDIAVEASTPERAKELLGQAIDDLTDVVTSHGLKFVGG